MLDNPIICALDTANIDNAIQLAKLIKGKVSMIKLGLEFFTAHGISGVKVMSQLDIPIFLDLKLHDIPNTVARAISIIKDLNIKMMTIHISGGKEMILRAMDVLLDSTILLVGVTVLTSIDNNDLRDVGIYQDTSVYVDSLVKLAVNSGLKGIVCSAYEVKEIRNKYCDLKLIVPGIRIMYNDSDQKRISDPKTVILDGANYLVIGRPITQSHDPICTIENILSNIYS
ncbi:orotidine-5'-phosphate decarboxylase [Neoehrlichia mikurensis]|uniref:orotidine-5'-phosphate decarboxylase n=1 Tax=Neoehrlichia mikurensis TaxID=89586 RepID=UPI001C46F675|nr:orotidine-5'-phosphate decarboxylase [Neoehrlichia mikurensis]QXK92531.1 orotidine-5'-phosphate decarboxylase [Neoehrlichia mikurensis]QXK93767.1 orotidine-5'-phosphate decarboxylase [Neoehrlichia mikurensis]